jgi:hypothetical protein
MERARGNVIEAEENPGSDHGDPTGDDERDLRQIVKYDERNDWPAMLIWCIQIHARFRR